MMKEVRGLVIGIGLTLGAFALAQNVQRTLNVLVNGQPNADKAIVVNNTSYVPARVLRNFGVNVTAQGNNLLLNGASSGGSNSAPTGGASNPAQSNPAQSNPAQSNPSAGAAGTTQLAGTDARLNTQYTVGKREPLNFTLNAAEFRLEPIALGNEVKSAKGNEKLLLLRFTVQNPTQAERRLSWQSFKITAVDSRDVNYEFNSYYVRDGETKDYDSGLKASQRVNLVVAVIVANTANITKLLVERKGETAPIVRYDLRNKIKPLAAPYSPDGFTALTEIAAQRGTNYTMEWFSSRVEGFGFTSETLDGKQPSEGNRFLTVTVVVKNISQIEDARVTYNYFRAAITDSDGATTENNNYIVRASGGDSFESSVKPGAEVRFRYFFEVGQNQTFKQFTWREASEGRSFVYDLSELR